MAGRRNRTDADRARDARSAFGSPEGMRILGDMMAQAHVLTPVPSSDPVELAKAEGARALVQWIMSLIHHRPERFDGAALMKDWNRIDGDMAS